MSNKIFIYLIFQLLATQLLSKDSFQFSFSPLNDNVETVLVLAPGMNTDGVFFLKEAPWMEFAKRNNLPQR